MKNYVVVTGLIWLLILTSHVARLLSEGSGLLKVPAFVVTSLVCLGLAVWAGTIIRRRPPDRASHVATPDRKGSAE